MEKKLTIENTRGLVDPCIYMLTAPNGKIYVGSAFNGFHLRSSPYRKENAHGVIDSALKKYGASSFTFSIPESSKAWGKDKLQEREQHYLDKLQPFGKLGYNIERVAGIVESMKRGVSQFTRAGEPMAFYESLARAEIVTGIAATNINSCCKGRKLSAGGFIWLYSEDATQQEVASRGARAASGSVWDPTPRPVSQYTRAGIFVKEHPSATQAARDASVGRANITACCNGKKLSAGGFLWLHSEEVTPQEIERRVKQADEKKLKRPVSQYTRTGVLVKVYPTASQAARETGAGSSSISMCCKGKQASAGDYLWLYPEDITSQEIERRVKQAADKKLEKPVLQYTRAGVLVKKYESASQAARETGVVATSVSACARDEIPSAGGTLWLYSEDVTPQEVARRVGLSADKKRERPIFQYTRTGVLTAAYPTVKQAASETGALASNISTCCKGKIKSAGGFIWKYA